MDTRTEDQSVEVSLFNAAQINSLPVTIQQIDRFTKKSDPCLSELWHYFSISCPHTPMWQISGFLLLITMYPSSSIVLEVQTLLPFAYCLLKYEIIDHVQHYGYLEGLVLLFSSSWWVDKVVQNIVISCFHCYIACPTYKNHAYYRVFQKYKTLVLSHLKFSTDKSLVRQAQSLFRFRVYQWQTSSDLGLKSYICLIHPLAVAILL